MADKLRKGYIFDVNGDHTVFIDSEDFIVVNAWVIYPRYRLKIKKMSKAELLDEALSFYYALFDDVEKKLTLKSIKIAFVNPDTKVLAKIVTLLSHHM